MIRCGNEGQRCSRRNLMNFYRLVLADLCNLASALSIRNPSNIAPVRPTYNNDRRRNFLFANLLPC